LDINNPLHSLPTYSRVAIDLFPRTHDFQKDGKGKLTKGPAKSQLAQSLHAGDDWVIPGLMVETWLHSHFISDRSFANAAFANFSI